MQAESLIVGVDAGGTKSTAWLGRVRDRHALLSNAASLDEAIELLGRGKAGPGNPRAVGFERATQSMLAAIASAFGEAQLSVSPVAAICMGVAGAGRPDEQRQLRSWCSEMRVAAHARITGDAAPVLAAVYGGRPVQQLQSMRGVALISGTGSMAWGCNGLGFEGGGREARSGGWGYLLGDEGSGYWIALEGLRAACQSSDGRGPATQLLPAMLERLELRSAAELIGKVYGQPLERRQIAALAQVVIAQAESTEAADPVAIRIVDRAADELSRMVSVLVEQLDLKPPNIPLALAGGLLLHATSLRAKVEQHLKPMGMNMTQVESPVQGALYMAAGLLA